ncbi:MAG: septum formation initiator family protein [Lactobacillus sp.]|jgi:cell division protein DivIC|nr:septum formation initiator family protein [Lactobacillus sp.]MCH3905841.1 septum formation initiator family protein [Lactobacillus sp.]MCH3990577.1 septum formation initiator family protein [Lactobacillus sp.]MCH4068708.1 septum formation initiator family protein [Lactobacillus sp.]MCI1303807.1 septum formation initiator family protein [Lactobacillus sp.]
MNNPRIYNALSDEARVQRLLKKQQRHEREVHRVRRNRIIAIFAIVFIFLGVQLGVKIMRTKQINQQVASQRQTVTKIKHQNKKLQEKVSDLKDPNYVAKMIRYKYYYSKPGETIYTIPEKADDEQ